MMDTLNQYLYRGTKPRPMPTPAPKRISTPAGHRLSTIMESSSNTNATDSRRQRPANLSLAQRLHLGTPPRASFEKRPPSYATQDGLSSGDLETAAAREKPPSDGWLKDKLRGRGGWKRLALIVGLVLVVIIALAVGLGVGLSNNDSDDNGGSSGPQPFPAGAWTFDTFLTSVSTDCTPRDETWTCSPYSVYTPQTPTLGATAFTWIIHSSSSSSTQFTISSSDNPLSIEFHNAPLTLRDANTPNEHYSFTVQNWPKQVYPAISLTGDQNRTVCFYEDATFSANLYTRKAATLGMVRHQMLAAQSGSIFKSWPHAVEAMEAAHGGNGVPKCYRTWNGEKAGNPIPLPAQSTGSTCSCGYENFVSS